MSGNATGIVKLFGYDDDFKVGLGTVRNVVIVAFVDDLEMQWLKRVQLSLDFLLDVHIQPSICKNAVIVVVRPSSLPCIASVQHPH